MIILTILLVILLIIVVLAALIFGGTFAFVYFRYDVNIFNILSDIDKLNKTVDVEKQNNGVECFDLPVLYEYKRRPAAYIAGGALTGLLTRF